MKESDQELSETGNTGMATIDRKRTRTAGRLNVSRIRKRHGPATATWKQTPISSFGARRAGLTWQAVIDQHAADAHILVAEYLKMDIREFGSQEQRIEAWMAAVNTRDPKAAASRASWHRYRNEVEFAGRKSDRIVLERSSPPDETRPFDSPVSNAEIKSEPEWA